LQELKTKHRFDLIFDQSRIDAMTPLRGERRVAGSRTLSKRRRAFSDRIIWGGRTGRSRSLRLLVLVWHRICSTSQTTSSEAALGAGRNAMEINVKCRKDEKGHWVIENPGKVFVRERRVVWTFEGLEPGIVPLLAFEDNAPHGPFPDIWLTASTFAAELEELPGTSRTYRYSIVLAQWNPEQSSIVAELSHELSIEAHSAFPIKVSWHRGQERIHIEPEELRVGGASLVEWQFEIPEDVFVTIDFGSPDRNKGLRPMGPFPELHGRRSAGVYRLTGQTDLVQDSYKYSVTLYDRTTDQVIIREDPKIDNFGEPPGPPAHGNVRQEPGGAGG
jgi:hypothetical protein